jgi:hypothetical protein
VRSFLAGAAAAVLLAGCTAHAQSGTSQPGNRPRAAAGVRGSRAQAQAYVRHLMAELNLPEGTTPAHVPSLPQIARVQAPAAPGWAGASRILLVPGQPLAVLRRISAHAPFNEPVIYSVTPVLDGTVVQAPEAGIDAAVLDLAVQAHSRTTTLVGAYAFAAWLPYRTDAASFRAVTIVRDQAFATQHPVSRTFTSPAVIARLAAFLNGRSPAPPSLVDGLSCAPQAGYTLRFTPRDKHGPAVTVSPAACQAVAITVDGKPQPLLWDTDGGLEAIASKALGGQLQALHLPEAGPVRHLLAEFSGKRGREAGRARMGPRCPGHD